MTHLDRWLDNVAALVDKPDTASLGSRDRIAIACHAFKIDRDRVEIDAVTLAMAVITIQLDRDSFEFDRDPFKSDAVTLVMSAIALAIRAISFDQRHPLQQMLTDETDDFYHV